MSNWFKVALATSLFFVGSIGPAAAQSLCSAGSRVAFVGGEIDNNAVEFPGPLPVTLGVADLRLSIKEGPQPNAPNRIHKLTCALSGIPHPDPTSHDFDHRIVCNDTEQSQLSFDTSFTRDAPIDPMLEVKICRGDVNSYFQELAIPDLGQPRKGLFQDVSGGQVFIEGCVSFGADANNLDPDIQINMVVDGHLCLTTGRGRGRGRAITG